MTTEASTESKRSKTDWEAEYEAGLMPRISGVEADIVDIFVRCATGGHAIEDRIPLNPDTDTIIREMSFKYGRADIVIFHVDGSASVIEAKDGSRGYNHVVSGIGQASLYAAQLGARAGAVTKVRKCLLWTSTGDAILDGVIEDVCLTANTIPLPWGDITKHISIWNEVIKRARAAKEAA